MSERSVSRFDAGLLAALGAIGGGLAFASTTLVLAAVPGLVYATYAKVTAVPELELDVSRECSDRSPLPGEEVELTLRVTNDGDRTLTDLRIVDGVPDGLDVVSGPATKAVSLRPGATTALSYTVAARRGVFAFDPAIIEASSASGAQRRSMRVDPETTIRCAPRFDQLPVRDETTQYPGRTATDQAGDGVEFYATREYQPGDPMARIDWNRLARTAELTTVQFRADRAATVVVVVDARPSVAVGPTPNASDGVELAGFLAERAIDALAESGHRVALAVIGNRELRWIGAGSGTTHRARCRRTIQSASAIAASGDGGAGRPASAEPQEDHPASTPPDATIPIGGDPVEVLRPRLPPNAQLLVASPLVDRPPVDWTEGCVAAGHPATVLSPNPTTNERYGGTVSGIERALRIDDLYASATPVVDWSPGEPVEIALADTFEGWSA